MVRGRGYFRSVAKDIENVVLKTDGGVPLRVKDVARVETVPDERRGITELERRGRSGERYRPSALRRQCAHRDRERQEARLAEITTSLPKGTEIIPVYDRSELIKAAIETLKSTLIEESIVVALVTSPSCCISAAPWSPSSCCRSAY
jgi:Cu(I)/Ag(I) efflux system membrane protein CusA/SilA